MRDMIIFSIQKNLYGLDLDLIQRIIPLPALTSLPDEHLYVDGMMSYEGKVLKVLSFRKMIGLPTYDDELRTLFTELEHDHKEWIDALATAVVEDKAFAKTTDPHSCRLGQWLDGFTSYDDEVMTILRRLNKHHMSLHHWADGVLSLRKESEERALTLLQTDIMKTYEMTMSNIGLFVDKFSMIADSLQKMLIYQDGSALFGIKVDDIDDIASVDETTIRPMDDIKMESEHMEIEGVVEIDGKLVNVIRSVRFPTSEVA